MGYLTTFTIYNDGLDQIDKHKEEFARHIVEAAALLRPSTISIGCHANLIKCHKPRHSSDCTIYVHEGNTVCEMSPYSQETKRIMQTNPQYFESMLKTMESSLRQLKEDYKNLKKPIHDETEK